MSHQTEQVHTVSKYLLELDERETMENIKSLLESHRNLQECVLLDIRWLHFGTTIELIFDYVWDESGKIRADLNQKEPVIVRLKLVQELHLNNALNESMILEPYQINWGINEVAAVRLEENQNMLKPYNKLPKPFHHIAVLWERGNVRRIDVVFSEMEIMKGLKAVPIGKQ